LYKAKLALVFLGVEHRVVRDNVLHGALVPQRKNAKALPTDPSFFPHVDD